MADKRRRSLVARLALAYALVALVLVGLGSLVLYHGLLQATRRDDAEDVRHASEVVALRMGQGAIRDTEALDVEAGVMVRVLDAQGRTLLESEGMDAAAPASLFPTELDRLSVRRSPPGPQLLTVASAWKGGRIQAAKDITRQRRLLESYQRTLVLTSLLVALLAAAAGWILAKRGLAPLAALAEATAAIRPATLGTRLDAAGAPAELAAMTGALNQALAHLEEAFGRLTALNADLAHELRTPLHALRLELEALLDSKTLDPLLRERLGAMAESLEHLAALIEQMLFLARAEDPATLLERRPLELAAAFKDALRPFEVLAEEQGVALRLEAAPGASVDADPTLLRRALHNLLGNALRHTPAGGEVALIGSADCIEVRDSGEGMEPAQLQQLGQRFLRLDASRSRGTGGTGLGLAIVQSILRLHGGHMEVESEPGRGTCVRLRFARVE